MNILGIINLFIYLLIGKVDFEICKKVGKVARLGHASDNTQVLRTKRDDGIV